MSYIDSLEIDVEELALLELLLRYSEDATQTAIVNQFKLFSLIYSVLISESLM